MANCIFNWLLNVFSLIRNPWKPAYKIGVCKLSFFVKWVLLLFYYQEYDEDPSAESFFGVLTETLHSTPIENLIESTMLLDTSTTQKKKPDLTLLKSDFIFQKGNTTSSTKFLLTPTYIFHNTYIHLPLVHVCRC